MSFGPTHLWRAFDTQVIRGQEVTGSSLRRHFMSGGLKEQQALAAFQKSGECSRRVNSGNVQGHPTV